MVHGFLYTGSGGAVILILLYKFRNKPFLEFVYTIILCGAIEYFTGLIIELTHNRSEMVGLHRIFLKSARKNLH